MRLVINYKEKNCENHNHVEAKQYVTKQPMDHSRNHKIAKDKWKHNDRSEWDAAKAVLRGKYIAIHSYIKK